MAEAKRISDEANDPREQGYDLEGFEQFFEGESSGSSTTVSTTGNVELTAAQMEKLVERLSELITLSVDQRIETSKIANQLMENQRQLVATQQILINLMERSIEVTRHVTSIEERLPAIFELPRIVESLRLRVAQLEGIETR
ncbi:MAG: hypothetical protein KC777_14505 [Cyanobacteria bacterium HKST-UBA02]|nr:hypothetical protein [Cyanobacteria bacterium HKST-UBA02]